ncbi:hypothetical protein AtNW77_Chr1g0035451 [Arabidopsis thaliana]|uniref:Defensin-like (DEFL) family protein n=1 Tax=Arabidopsis thaliana TaxID=3702 RepID=A0A1P8AVH4_ARATH|nr:Defensin-like (DEFL) family protein [Arabidopsis thaliana]ANM60643.1 Defensin-like (DEFL) family protein [Arabidopsis thaliana]|eukprot:NP_001322915.1 Defensin-like (DEFL) family protein [Arabidopsis thaliana]
MLADQSSMITRVTWSLATYQDLKKGASSISIRCLHASTIRLGVHITHEKVAACPRQNQRLYSCDSLRILYHYSCLTTRDLLYICDCSDFENIICLIRLLLNLDFVEVKLV